MRESAHVNKGSCATTEVFRTTLFELFMKNVLQILPAALLKAILNGIFWKVKILLKKMNPEFFQNLF